MKKIISLLLIFAFAVCALIGCNNSEEQESESTEATQATTAAPTQKPSGTTTETDEYGQNMLVSAVPVDELDFDGQDITILVRDVESYYREFTRKEGYIDQNDLDEAISTRNAQIVSDLNITVNFEYHGGTQYNDVRDQFDKIVRQDAGLEEHNYDLVANYAHVGARGQFREFWANLADKDIFPYFDFTLPCWNQSIYNSTFVNGKLYFAAGDLNLTVFDRSFVIWLNKELYDQKKTDSDPADLQDQAIAGDWKYADLYYWTSMPVEDTNGKSGTQCNDTFIMESYFGSVPIDALPYAWDIDLVKDTNDGFVEYNIENNEKLANGVKEAYDILNNVGVNQAQVDLPGYTQCTCANKSCNRVIHHFINGTSMFAFYLLCDSESDATAIRGMEHKFGILPIPKYDENQKYYGTSSQDAYNLMTAINHGDYSNGDLVSAYLQLANELSYTNVRAYYIERIIKGKTFGTWTDGTVEKSVQIFDECIADHIEFSFITIYAPQLNDVMNNCWRNAVTNKSTAWDEFQTKAPTYTSDLQSLKDFLFPEE
ncbi:MAG: hypothetical protein E7623_08000 [Ruminococcaceae bacterium]|nr:hypothetical protein [Oscillospiraceae bacterium]